MDTKKILIVLGVAGAIGAYLYFNKKNKPRPRPRNNGGASDTDDTTDTSDTTDVTTGTNSDTNNGGNGGTNVNIDTPNDVQIITAPSLTEEEILILSCNSVGGTWINSTCVYTNSPNPRSEVVQTDFDIFDVRGGSGSTSTSGSLGTITNPKTGYTVGGTSGGTKGGTSTANYNLEFSGLKNWF